MGLYNAVASSASRSSAVFLPTFPESLGVEPLALFDTVCAVVFLGCALSMQLVERRAA